jgi:hypothetical protein
MVFNLSCFDIATENGLKTENFKFSDRKSSEEK